MPPLQKQDVIIRRNACKLPTQGLGLFVDGHVGLAAVRVLHDADARGSQAQHVFLGFFEHFDGKTAGPAEKLKIRLVMVFPRIQKCIILLIASRPQIGVRAHRTGECSTLRVLSIDKQCETV